MAFTGNEGSSIEMERAIALTRNYREANPQQVLSCFLGRDILQALLDQGGSKGIRFYYGLDGGVSQLVAVSANEAEDDQLDAGYLVADEGVLGPPRCGRANKLNS